jgi:succinyl-CoA synthetase alpha subunit
LVVNAVNYSYDGGVVTVACRAASKLATAPPEKRMGHAGAIIEGGEGDAPLKFRSEVI